MSFQKLTIPEILKNSFTKFSDNHFLGFSDENSFTYKEVKEKIEIVIANLKKIGITKSDKVAIFSNNMTNWGIVYFATTSIGAVAVPILPDFGTEELNNILQHSEAKVLFVAGILEDKIQNIDKQNLKAIVRTNDLKTLYPENLEFDFSIKSNFEESINADENDLASIIYTSGTTGKSKGVMLSHKNICFNAVECGKVQPIREDDIFLSILPLSHAYENTLGLILPMMNGAQVKYLRKLPTPAILVPALQTVRPTIMLSVPLIIEKIYKSKIIPAFNSKKLIKTLYKIPIFRKWFNEAAGRKLMKTFGGKIRFFGIGGAKLDPVVEKFLIEAKFPYAIGYGLTETSPLIAGVNPKTVRLQSTGPKIEGTELKLMDVNPKSGEGEIWVRGESVMKGYYKDEALTSEVLTEDGWFKTGDLAVMDKDGYVFIKGRKKNVIIGASGENIYPEDIESIINNFDFVLESIVVEEKGRLVALVHLNMEEMEKKYKNFKNEMEVKLEEYKTELLNYINTKVNKFSNVKKINIQKEPFEKTPTQKIKRYKYKSDS